MGFADIGLSPFDSTLYYKKNSKYADYVGKSLRRFVDGNYYVNKNGVIRQLRNEYKPLGYVTEDVLLLFSKQNWEKGDLYLYWINNDNYKKIHSDLSTQK